MARKPGTTLSRTIEVEDNSQNGESTVTTPNAPEFDFAAFANDVEDAPVDELTRESGAGRPKQENPFTKVVLSARQDGKVKQLVVPAKASEKVQGLLRRAASENGHGLRVKWQREAGDKHRIYFQAVDKKNTGDKVECPVCHQTVTVTGKNTIRIHGPRDMRCAGSEKPVETPAA